MKGSKSKFQTLTVLMLFPSFLLLGQNTTDFITVWRTEMDSETIMIPTFFPPGVYEYDYDVDWRDGTMTTSHTGNVTHSYTNIGEEHLMRDDLRLGGHLPLATPYGDQRTVKGQSALLQWDGDIVSTDGLSILELIYPIGSYHVVVGHRNHFQKMKT